MAAYPDVENGTTSLVIKPVEIKDGLPTTETGHEVKPLPLHPEYELSINAWERYRDAFNGGTKYIAKYLKTYSTYESSADYDVRKSITYCPAHAKAAVLEVMNAIHQRLVDVSRFGGSPDYVTQTKGENGGVDKFGNNMNRFMGDQVLKELVITGKVGIYVDRENRDTILKSDGSNRKYLYIYKAENILNWSYDENGELTTVVLKDYVDIMDPEYGLVTKEDIRIRLYRKVDNGITVSFYNEKGKQTSKPTFLHLKKIPLCILEINQSLLKDIETYQQALLQLVSTDMTFVTKGNFPFYIEQRNDHDQLFSKHKEVDGTDKSDDKHILSGGIRGRAYGEGLNEPKYIHPSPDPLRASMEKQDQLKQEIRQILSLNLTTIEPRRQSAESREMDSRSLESGLSAIGQELAAAEYLVAKYWHLYDNEEFKGKITYPSVYTIRTDDERLKEAITLYDFGMKIPSAKYQKIIAKKIVSLSIGSNVPDGVIKEIDKDIDDAKVIMTDPEILRADLEAGLVSNELASSLRGYPLGEVEKAKLDHIERVKSIAMAQSEAAARGVADMSANPSEDAKNEKKQVEMDKENE